jgi:hypothetical protein
VPSKQSGVATSVGSSLRDALEPGARGREWAAPSDRLSHHRVRSLGVMAPITGHMARSEVPTASGRLRAITVRAALEGAQLSAGDAALPNVSPA